MKRVFRTGLSVMLCVGLLCSLSACTVFSNMRENARKASMIQILDTPEEAALADVYRRALPHSLETCERVESRTSVEVRDAAVSPGDAGKDPALLDAAAGQLATLIMQNHPGSTEETLTPAQAENSMLKNLLDPRGAQLEATRHMKREAVTDEKGNEQADENGDTLTVEIVADNVLELVYRFYEDTVVAEATTDADGNETEAVTERAIAPDGEIEAAFGAPRDKAAMLSEFDAVKDYLQVEDYTFKYTDCTASCSVDLDENRLSEVTFRKNVTVTASVLGQGPFADYGRFAVSFTLGEVTAYEFHYPVEA